MIGAIESIEAMKNSASRFAESLQCAILVLQSEARLRAYKQKPQLTFQRCSPKNQHVAVACSYYLIFLLVIILRMVFFVSQRLSVAWFSFTLDGCTGSMKMVFMTVIVAVLGCDILSIWCL